MHRQKNSWAPIRDTQWDYYYHFQEKKQKCYIIIIFVIF